MKNIAIIPARSGSKGVPDKNIRLLGKKPLLVYSIEAALKSQLFDEIMVSTDSEEYAEISRKYGAVVPFLRSRENSSDTASSVDAIIEVLGKYADVGRCFDSVCLLQPTSPLRTSEDIVEAYGLFMKKNAGAVASVCPVDHPPQWSMKLPDDDSLDDFRERDPGVPRQQLGEYFRMNGAIFINRIVYDLDRNPELQMKPEYAYRMSRNGSIDIDEEIDFRIAEALLNEQ